MAEATRITEFGNQTFKLVSGIEVSVRPLTFKEKREYLAMIEAFKSPEAKEKQDTAGDYLTMQVEVAFFILSRLNPELKKEDVEAGLNGEVFKKILDIAFYDPFALFNR